MPGELGLGAQIGLGAANSLFSTVGSLFNSGQQYRRQKDLLKMQQDYATQAATTAYNRQLEFWNKQNAYNTASAQRGRLEAAGLNPALMYSGSGASTPAQGLSSVSQADGGSAPPAPRSQWANPIDEALKIAQLKIAESTANLNNANADKARGDTKDVNETQRAQKLQNEFTEMGIKGARAENALKEFNLHMAYELEDVTIAQAKEQLNIMIQSGQKLLHEATHYLLENSLYNEKRDQIQATTKNILADLLVKGAQVKALEAGKRLTEEQIVQVRNEAEKLVSEKNLVDKHVEYFTPDRVFGYAGTIISALALLKR